MPRKPPAGLGTRGRALWRWLQGFEPEPHETIQVLEACRITDRLDALAKIIAKEGTLDRNAKGELVAHAALVESRQQTAILNRTLAALRIPEPGPGSGGEWDGLSASSRSRKAALARHYPRGARA